MGKITLKNIVNKLEEENKYFNKCIKGLEDKIYRSEEESEIKLIQLKAQNELLGNMFKEFNMNENSYVYEFKNTTNTNVKTIDFVEPIQINKVSLNVFDFIYTSPIRLKVTFNTIDMKAITVEMLPFDFRGEYIEEIKFYKEQKKSLFKCLSSEKLEYFDIIKIDDETNRYVKLETDYTEKIDEEGYIEFNTNHKKDRVLCKYTPIKDEFIKSINSKITSISLEIDKKMNKKINLNIIK